MLGALTSLLVINGIALVPLSPVLLHYFIHGSDLNAIHPMLLSNWYPTLRQLIQDWLAIGPTGDPTPFESRFNGWRHSVVGVVGLVSGRRVKCFIKLLLALCNQITLLS
jgi:hypothetical protein